MKVGILTFHQSVNNGAVMQAYSLSKKLKELYPSHEIEIVDYQMKKVQQMYTYTLKKYFRKSPPILFAKKVFHLIRYPMLLKHKQQRTEVFANCLEKLPLSPKRICSDDVDEVYAYINERYDVLIVGSDAIWNYISRGFGNAYLPDCRITCKKLSYAASCYGMDYLKRPQIEKAFIKDSLDGFVFIGVRDDATEGFVQWSGCEIAPTHTCDPTVFLDVDDLPIDEDKMREKLKRRGFDFGKKTIGVMGSSKMLKMIRRMYSKRYQIVALYEHPQGADVYLDDLEPYEWAYVFRFFALTFTTYFHGTLLSLRNGVPVVCIALPTAFSNHHTPKTQDVLTRLGFSNWYFKTDYMMENIEAIRKQADDFLTHDYKERIINAMNTEARSFDSFNNVLQQILK